MSLPRLSWHSKAKVNSSAKHSIVQRRCGVLVRVRWITAEEDYDGRDHPAKCRFTYLCP